MNYYKNVYLRRVNRFGRNLQERIINKKEYDFHNFVKKSPNRVTVFIQDYQFEGVLQTKTYDEIETIDYFLTYKSIPISNGAILKIQSINEIDQYSYWIIVAKDNFTSAGYNRYTVIKLDREIRWITSEGLIYKALAHISGSGSGGTNRRLVSATKIVNESVVYMPNQVLTVTMQDHEEIKRGIRINIGSQVWKISGFDNITNEGVSYVTLEQDYFDKELDDTKHLDNEPPYQNGFADGQKIERWTFDSSLRENLDDNGNKWIELIEGEEIPVTFRASYFDKPTEKDFIVEVNDLNVVKYNKVERTLIGKIADKETYITVRLKDSPDIEDKFYIKVVPNDSTIDTFSVEGAARMKYGIPTVFESIFSFELQDIPDNTIVRKIGQITKNGQQFYQLEIIISQIVKNLSLNFVAENGQTYSKIVSVESPWIGG